MSIKSFATTHRAADVEVGQKIHLDAFYAKSLTLLTTTTFRIEAESGDTKPKLPRQFCLGVDLSNFIKYARVSRGVSAWRSPDRQLIHHDHSLDLTCSPEGLMRTGASALQSESTLQSGSECLIDQTAFARAANPRHADKKPQGQFQIHILEVVGGHPAQVNFGVTCGPRFSSNRTNGLFTR